MSLPAWACRLHLALKFTSEFLLSTSRTIRFPLPLGAATAGPPVSRVRGRSAGDDGRGGYVGIDRGQARPRPVTAPTKRSSRCAAIARHRSRAVPVKMVASALTIARGGSGGREGTTAQISAGLLTADPPAEPVQRTDRGMVSAASAPSSRCATGRSGVGRLDPLPRRLRLPQPAAGFHRLGNRLRVLGADSGLRPAVRPSTPVSPSGMATTVVRGDRADRSRRRLLTCPSLSPRWQLRRLPGARCQTGDRRTAGRTLGLPIPQIEQRLMAGRSPARRSGTLLSIPLWIVTSSCRSPRSSRRHLSIGTGGSGGLFGPGIVIVAFVRRRSWRLGELTELPGVP